MRTLRKRTYEYGTILTAMFFHSQFPLKGAFTLLNRMR
jgi:hypothetical protein